MSNQHYRNDRSSTKGKGSSPLQQKGNAPPHGGQKPAFPHNPQKGGSEGLCRLCGLDSFGFIRIPGTRHDCCLPCSQLVRFELEKFEKGGDQ